MDGTKGSATEEANITDHCTAERASLRAADVAGPNGIRAVNELGVVFLFGAMAWQLGFVVHRLQSEFPDCEAMRRMNDDTCRMVRIEFEYESRNFLKHMHPANGCDMIVCWRHNWSECPLEVIELSKVLSHQLSAFSQIFSPQINADKH